MLPHLHQNCSLAFTRYLSSVSRKKITNRKTVDYVKSYKSDLAFASYECTKSYSQENPEPTPIFVLHDLLGSKNNWNSFCKKVHSSTKAKVIAVDARNHGESPHFDLNSYDDLVIDLKEFIERNNLKKVHLLGHSVGGRTAMLFALKYPDLVEKLIVADISPFSSSSTWKQVRQVLEILDKLRLPSDGTLVEAGKTVGENLMTIIKRKTLVSFLLTNLIKKNDGSFAWRFNIKALLQNFDRLQSFPDVHNLVYNGPVLFIGGAKSDHIQKSDFPKILQLFPNAELKYIEGAGHWLHSEKPTEFLNLTLEFLNRDVPISSPDISK